MSRAAWRPRADSSRRPHLTRQNSLRSLDHYQGCKDFSHRLLLTYFQHLPCPHLIALYCNLGLFPSVFPRNFLLSDCYKIDSLMHSFRQHMLTEFLALINLFSRDHFVSMNQRNSYALKDFLPSEERHSTKNKYIASCSSRAHSQTLMENFRTEECITLFMNLFSTCPVLRTPLVHLSAINDC